MSRSAKFLFVACAPLCVTGPAWAQNTVGQQQLVQELQAVSTKTAVIDVDKMRQEVTVEISTQNSEDVTGRDKYRAYFTSLPNFDVEIEFDFDSDRIKPNSFRALGAMADAMHHPVLLDDKFLIVGHTDAKGSRQYNLELSQRRADAIRNTLITVFRLPPERLAAFGLGEEQLRDPANPESGTNRRVQLINLGPMVEYR
jgi:outer membrane protein OmpA-like peptidoglycan-associated protein